MQLERYVILHNIRSRHNVGSIFRTADGAGVAKIYLTGYTPTPIDRFGREVPEIIKTSLGATTMVPWEHFEDIEVLLGVLKQEGVTVVAIEQTKDALSYKKYQELGPTAYIFGNEVEGVASEICEKADVVLVIPMLGSKESLNVSVCAGIILFNID